MKRISIKKVEYLFETNRWDGPTAGHCKINGKRYFFKLADEDYRWPWWWPFKWRIFGRYQDAIMPNRVRTFYVYDLPEEVWKVEDECHEDFRKWVGTHCDYVDGVRKGKVAPYKYHARFYKKWPAGKQDGFKPEWRVAKYVER